MKTKKVARSAITGKFVSLQYSLDNPNTTIVDTVVVKDKVKEVDKVVVEKL